MNNPLDFIGQTSGIPSGTQFPPDDPRATDSSSEIDQLFKDVLANDPQMAGLVAQIKDHFSQLDAAGQQDALAQLKAKVSSLQESNSASQAPGGGIGAMAMVGLGGSGAPKPGKLTAQDLQGLVTMVSNISTNSGSNSPPGGSTADQSSASGPTSYYDQGTGALINQAWQMPDQMAQDEADFKAVSGDDAKAAYQQYVEGWRLSHPSQQTYSQQAEQQGPRPGVGMKSYDDWLGSHLQAAYGPALKAIDIISQAYQAKYNTPIPDALRQDLLKQMLNPAYSVQTASLAYALDQAMQQAKMADVNNTNPLASGTGNNTVGGAYETLANMLGANSQLEKFAPWIVSAISTYNNNNPTPAETKQQQDTRIASEFWGKLNRPPTADETKAMEGKTIAEIQNYVLQAKMANGMQYGAYADSLGRLQPIWTQYLGRQPNDNEIQHFATYSDQEINDWVDKQPSHIPGMPVGQYQSYSKTVDELSNKYYGYTSSDFLANLTKAMGK